MGPMRYDAEQAQAWHDHLQARVVQLEVENRELRRQLDELRRGIGIAVLIHGRPVPVSPLPPLAASQPTTPTPIWSASDPAALPYPPMSQSGSFPGRTYSAPLSTPLPAMPLPDPWQPGPHSQPFPESPWLTGQMRAVHAPQQPVTSGRDRPRPAEHVTPTWLREGEREREPSRPMPQQRRISGRTPARPIVPRLQPDRIPSLAELTGTLPAVRANGKQSRRGKSEYADSFVLE